MIYFFKLLFQTCAIAIVKDIKVYLPFIHCMEASKGEIKSAAEKVRPFVVKNVLVDQCY